jgi:hypothetical protein
MKHNLKINYITQYHWTIDATVNGESLTVNNDQITGSFDLLKNNSLEITFSGKDATVHPSMTLCITDFLFDYLYLTPLLHQAVYYTDHPDYPAITPCTDINLNGVWRLNFDNNIVHDALSNYLGTINE